MKEVPSLDDGHHALKRLLNICSMTQVIVGPVYSCDPIAMEAFDSTLKQQHEDIMKSFSELHQAWEKQIAPECKNAVAGLLKLLKEHHETERSLLFLKLWRQPRLKAGGPFCTYFFDFFMRDRPFSSALTRINLIRTPEDRMTEIPIPEILAPIFQENSMLCIPLEEHLALEAVVEETEKVIVSWNPKDKSWVSDTMDYLYDLLRKNIEKEETCLWTIAQEIHY